MPTPHKQSPRLANLESAIDHDAKRSIPPIPEIVGFTNRSRLFRQLLTARAFGKRRSPRIQSTPQSCENLSLADREVLLPDTHCRGRLCASISPQKVDFDAD